MTEAKTKKCPACAEEILRDARKCKHCGSAVPSDAAKKIATVLTALIFLPFGACLIAVIGASHTTPSSINTPSSTDWAKHEELVRMIMSVVLNGLQTDPPANIYALATKDLAEPYTANCHLDGCSDLRGFLRKAKEITGDGVVTPAEVDELIEYGKAVNLSLAGGAAKVREVAKRK